MSVGWSAVLVTTACLLLLVGVGCRTRTRLDRRLREPDAAAVSYRGRADVYERAAGFGRFVRPFRGALVITVLLALVDASLGLAGAWPLKLVIDNALGGQPLPAGLPLVGGLSGSAVVGVAVLLGVGLVAASALLGYLVVMLVSTLSLGIAADLRTAVFNRLLTLPVLVHDRHRSGDLVTRLTTDVAQVQQALVARVQVALPNVAKLVGMTALMLLIDPPLALIVMAAIPPLAVLAIVRQRRVATTQRASRARFGDLAARAAEVLRHVRAVQVFGQQAGESTGFRQSCATSATASSEAMRTSARLAPLTDLTLALVLGAVLWIGTGQVQTGALTLGGLTVFLAYLASVRGPVAALSGLAATLGRGTASAERLTELLDERPLPQPATALPAPSGPVELRLDGVRFGYRAEAPVLREVSLTVPAGSTACVVGPTGAGKSTLLSLLARLHDPDAGSVRIGGIDLRQLALDDVRRLVGFVPQDGWIMAGSIADNIRYGTAQATDEQVSAAAAAAMVDEFADRLPEGYETAVGEGGLLLSGGQRRRLALARALLRDSPVLLLDEPTAGLDTSSQRIVRQAIRRASAGRTVLIVSHDLALARTADLVLALADGHIAQAGHPDDLSLTRGLYGQLLASDERTHIPPRAA